MPDMLITAFASTRRDGETWTTNGFHFKREGGKTRRVSASEATPVPPRLPMPAGPVAKVTRGGVRVTLHPYRGTSPATPPPPAPLPPSAPATPPPDPAMASFEARAHARVRRLAMEWWPKIASIPTMTPALLATAGLGAAGALTGTPGGIVFGTLGASAMINKAMDRGSKKAKAVRLAMAKSAAEKRRAEKRNKEAYFSELAALTREFIEAFSEYESFAWHQPQNGGVRRYWVPDGKPDTPENRVYGKAAEAAARAAEEDAATAASRAAERELQRSRGINDGRPMDRGPGFPPWLAGATVGGSIGTGLGSLAGPAAGVAGAVGGAAIGAVGALGVAALEKARAIRARVAAAEAAGHKVGKKGGPVRRLVRRLTGFAEDGRPVYRFAWKQGKRGGKYWLPDGKQDTPANRLYGAKAEAAANAGSKSDRPAARRSGPKPGEAEQIARAKFEVARDAHAAASAPGSGVPADRVAWLKARLDTAEQELRSPPRPVASAPLSSLPPVPSQPTGGIRLAAPPQPLPPSAPTPPAAIRAPQNPVVRRTPTTVGGKRVVVTHRVKSAPPAPQTTQEITEIGTRVGRAMARDARKNGASLEWTGIEAQDADQFEAAGLVIGSPEWRAAEDAAEAEYRRVVGPAVAPAPPRSDGPPDVRALAKAVDDGIAPRGRGAQWGYDFTRAREVLKTANQEIDDFARTQPRKVAGLAREVTGQEPTSTEHAVKLLKEFVSESLDLLDPAGRGRSHQMSERAGRLVFFLDWLASRLGRWESFASSHKDGESWETNGFYFKREGGKTRRVAAPDAAAQPTRKSVVTSPARGTTGVAASPAKSAGPTAARSTTVAKKNVAPHPTVDELVALYQRLQEDRTKGVADVRAEYPDLSRVPRAVVEEMSRQLGYTPEKTLKATIARLRANLEDIKLHQDSQRYVGSSA